MCALKTLLIKKYQENDFDFSYFALDELLAFASSANNAQLVIKEDLVLLDNNEQLILFDQEYKPIDFPFTKYYQTLYLSDKQYRKLNLNKNSPFVFNQEPLYKIRIKGKIIKASIGGTFSIEPLNEEGESTSISPLTHHPLYQIRSKANDKMIFQVFFDHQELRILSLDLTSFHDDLFYTLIKQIETHFKQKFAQKYLILPHASPLLSYFDQADKALFYHLQPIKRINIHNYRAYQKKCQEIKAMDIKPRLLIHACCGPCSSSIIADLSEYFELSIYFYNPNIYPKREYALRLDEQKKIIAALNHPNDLIVPPFNSTLFYQAIAGLEEEDEGGKRCFACYRLRMEAACQYAKAHHFDFFTTTLSISPLKNADEINRIGIELEEKYKINFLYSNFKLNDGFLRSIKISKQLGLYRQDYCGCIFSKASFDKKTK